MHRNKSILFILLITGVLLSGFSTAGRAVAGTKKSHPVSDKGGSGALSGRSDSVSYAVGLLLGQQIGDSIAGYDPELFRFCFLAGTQEAQGSSEPEDAERKLVADYRKQHSDALKIAESEIQTQAMSAYVLGRGGMLVVKSYLLFDKKSGNPEVLYDAVLSGAVRHPASGKLVMDFEECRVYLESVLEKSAKEVWGIPD